MLDSKSDPPSVEVFLVFPIAVLRIGAGDKYTGEIVKMEHAEHYNSPPELAEARNNASAEGLEGYDVLPIGCFQYYWSSRAGGVVWPR